MNPLKPVNSTTTFFAGKEPEEKTNEVTTPLSLPEVVFKQQQEVARLKNLIRKYIDFMDENLGTTADWPMEAAFDDGEVCQQHCDLLNAMKREVKPEDIN